MEDVDPTCEQCDGQFDGGCSVCVKCWNSVNLQRREAAKMASILLDYIHALKRHEGSVENCGQKPCPATLEFLSKREKQKPEVNNSRECICGTTVDGMFKCAVHG